MAPTLIVLALLALGVAIVAWATRRRPGEQACTAEEQDTAWNDPMTRAGSATHTPMSAADPFANAPSVIDQDRRA